MKNTMSNFPRIFGSGKVFKSSSRLIVAIHKIVSSSASGSRHKSPYSCTAITRIAHQSSWSPFRISMPNVELNVRKYGKRAMYSVEKISDAKTPIASRSRGVKPKTVTKTNEIAVTKPAVFKLSCKPVQSAILICSGVAPSLI